MRPTTDQRKSFDRDGHPIAHRDFRPMERLPDGPLLKAYPAELQWKDGLPARALVTLPEPVDFGRRAA